MRRRGLVVSPFVAGADGRGGFDLNVLTLTFELVLVLFVYNGLGVRQFISKKRAQLYVCTKDKLARLSNLMSIVFWRQKRGYIPLVSTVLSYVMSTKLDPPSSQPPYPSSILVVHTDGIARNTTSDSSGVGSSSGAVGAKMILPCQNSQRSTYA